MCVKLAAAAAAANGSATTQNVACIGVPLVFLMFVCTWHSQLIVVVVVGDVVGLLLILIG